MAKRHLHSGNCSLIFPQFSFPVPEDPLMTLFFLKSHHISGCLKLQTHWMGG